MANVLTIPDLNPIQFYELNPVQADEYQTKWMDTYPFIQQLEEWQEPSWYAQKIQTTDKSPIQLESTFDPINIDLIDQYGNISGSLIAVLKIPNAYIPGAFVYEFIYSYAGTPEGCYLMRLSNPLSDLVMISEPLEIRDYHPNTKLIQYRNSRFHGDVIFETGITFEIRVECSFDLFDPAADIQLYENQKNDSQLLSARPYDLWPFVVGGTFGIPGWIIKKIFLAFCCNDVRIDGRSFCRNTEDAKVEMDKIEDYALRAMTLQLRPGINRQSKIVYPTIDTTKKLLVVYNIDTKLFGDTSSNAGSNLVPITSTE